MAAMLYIHVLNRAISDVSNLVEYTGINTSLARDRKACLLRCLLPNIFVRLGRGCLDLRK
jgi:hypothetical protein